MKCVELKDVKKLEVSDIEEPKKEEGKVMIEVSRCGICGSDIHNFMAGAPVGLVLGHEFCGKVLYNGGREDLKEGDRVTALPISPCGHCEACLSGNINYCPSTWSSAIGLSLENPGGLTRRINVRSDMVIKVPDDMSDEEVSMVEPTAVSLHAINLANITKDSTVLVVGGGIIGLGSAMLAKKAGAKYVAISETNDYRGEKAVELKVADEFFKVSDKMQEEIRAKVPNGFDVVIECCGNGAAVTSALMATKNGGTVVLVGVSYDPITIPTVITVLNEITMKGAIAYTKEEFETCIELIANKEIDVMKFVSEIVTLDEVQASFDKLISKENDAIKILVDVG